MSTISISPGATSTEVCVSFHYNASLVELIKALPREQRSFDTATKTWTVDATAAKDFATQAQSAGHLVVRPTATSASAPPATPTAAAGEQAAQPSVAELLGNQDAPRRATVRGATPQAEPAQPAASVASTQPDVPAQTDVPAPPTLPAAPWLDEMFAAFGADRREALFQALVDLLAQDARAGDAAAIILTVQVAAARQRDASIVKPSA